MKYQGGKLYQDLSIHMALILEGRMVMFSLTYPPWNSKTNKNLNILIAELSEFNRKLPYTEIMYLLQDLYSIT